MSLFYKSHPFTRQSKQEAITTLLDNITPDRDFYLLLIGSTLLAIGGIFLDSIPVLIASMIVAPLAYPILGFGLGIASKNRRLVFQSGAIVLTAFLISFILAMLVTNVFGHIRVDNTFISFSSNPYLAVCIALIAGAIAAYGLARPKVSNAITGVAIAVSLMPPLVATGIEIASRNMSLARSAFELFFLNVIGILIASVVTFTLLGIGREYQSKSKRE